jgi:hypothetical protein
MNLYLFYIKYYLILEYFWAISNINIENLFRTISLKLNFNSLFVNIYSNPTNSSKIFNSLLTNIKNNNNGELNDFLLSIWEEALSNNDIDLLSNVLEKDFKETKTVQSYFFPDRINNTNLIRFYSFIYWKYSINKINELNNFIKNTNHTIQNYTSYYKSILDSNNMGDYVKNIWKKWEDIKGLFNFILTSFNEYIKNNNLNKWLNNISNKDSLRLIKIIKWFDKYSGKIIDKKNLILLLNFGINSNNQYFIKHWLWELLNLEKRGKLCSSNSDFFKSKQEVSQNIYPNDMFLSLLRNRKLYKSLNKYYTNEYIYIKK